MAAKDDLGRRGEDLAAQFLRNAGYSIIDRNWRCPRGEIDLVARDGDDTVFIEVKTRSSTAFGHPFEAITAQKLARLKRLAHAWCDAHPHRAHAKGARAQGMRIDAISVIVAADRAPIIEHLRRVY
ncbi:MAG: YraN family protein [Terrimesophilobacter sp.]